MSRRGPPPQKKRLEMRKEEGKKKEIAPKDPFKRTQICQHLRKTSIILAYFLFLSPPP